MKSAIVAMLCLALMLRTSQTQVQKLPVAVTWNYYPQPKTLILHLLNNSGKDIIGYNVTVGWKNADGTWNDRLGRLPYRRDSLVPLVMIQMAKDPIAEERTQREFGNGPYATGTTQDVTLRWEINTDSGLDAVADVVFYADGTFYEQNEDAFKRMLANRQRQLLAMKKTNEIIQNALADSTNEHVIATVIMELSRTATESMSRKQDNFDPEQGLERFLEPVIRTMQMMQERRIGGYPGNTERERLRQYLDEQEKRVELMTPHCHFEIARKAVAVESRIRRLEIHMDAYAVSRELVFSLSPSHCASHCEAIAKPLRFVDLVEARNLRWPHYGGHRHGHRPDRLPLPHP